VFGRAGEEIAACRAAGVPVAIVPGVTAAQGAAASLGVSLTHRDHAQRVQFVTGHGRQGGLPADLDYAALADPRATTCVYMGRKTAAQLARRLIAEGLPARTPVVALSDVSRESERGLWSTIGDLAEGVDLPDAPTVLLIGAAMAAAGSAPREPAANLEPAAQRLRAG
jgi:uroporphyrin-III C-methyltransferase/precorrin-2 dehydrogenase/sirohydrochlorin ferrochelatase